MNTFRLHRNHNILFTINWNALHDARDTPSKPLLWLWNSKRNSSLTSSTSHVHRSTSFVPWLLQNDWQKMRILFHRISIACRKPKSIWVCDCLRSSHASNFSFFFFFCATAVIGVVLLHVGSFLLCKSPTQARSKKISILVMAADLLLLFSVSFPSFIENWTFRS